MVLTPTHKLWTAHLFDKKHPPKFASSRGVAGSLSEVYQRMIQDVLSHITYRQIIIVS